MCVGWGSEGVAFKGSVSKCVWGKSKPNRASLQSSRQKSTTYGRQFFCRWSCLNLGILANSDDSCEKKKIKIKIGSICLIPQINFSSPSPYSHTPKTASEPGSWDTWSIVSPAEKTLRFPPNGVISHVSPQMYTVWLWSVGKGGAERWNELRKK